MSFANRSVGVLLRSPLHPVLSGKVQLIRYGGRRSGMQHSTPTQYVELDSGALAILVGNPSGKRWWRNFAEPWPLDLLVRGEWRHTVARARWRHDDRSLVDAVTERFGLKYGRRHLPKIGTDVLIVVCEPNQGLRTLLEY